MPGGSAIGKAGTDATIREVSGGYSDAQAIVQPTQPRRTSRRQYVEAHAGGTPRRWIRSVAHSHVAKPEHAATIDVNIPGIDITKLKYNP